MLQQIFVLVFELNFILQVLSQSLSELSFQYAEENSVFISCNVTPPSERFNHPSPENFGIPWYFSWSFNNVMLASIGVLQNYDTYIIAASPNAYSKRTTVINEPRNVGHSPNHAFTSALMLSPFSVSDAGNVFKASIVDGFNVSRPLVISECTNPEYVISNPSFSPCLTGCRADLTCLSGSPGYANGVCQPEGHFLPNPECLKAPDLPLPIYTIPPSPDNTLVVGYTGLIVSVNFEKGSITLCAWRYNGEFDHSQFYIDSLGGCAPRNGITEAVSCAEDIKNGSSYISSNLTFLKPLNIDLDVAVECDTGLRLDLPRKTVQHCLPDLSHNLTVKPNYGSYGTIGKLACPNEGKLFYLNGSEPTTDVLTICLVSGLWNDPGGYRCWKDPYVTIDDNLVFAVGSNLNISCNYQDEYPLGHSSIFYFGDLAVSLPKYDRFIVTSLQPNDNNKKIFCQAATPFTKIYTESGQSGKYNLTVLFPPYQESTQKCVWLLGQYERCNVTVLANPPALFVDVEKNGVHVETFGHIIALLQRPVISMGHVHSFVFENVDRANHLDQGRFELIVKSKRYREHQRISFYVVVLDELPLPPVPHSWTYGYYSNVIVGLVVTFFSVATAYLAAEKWLELKQNRKDRAIRNNEEEGDDEATF